MTIIIASLFLPYQPQFELNANEGENSGLVASHLVKVNPSTDSLRRKRGSSIHSNTPFVGYDGSQDLLAPESTSRIGSPVPVLGLPRDNAVSSEKFMESLTAHGTSAGTPANPALGLPNTASAEDFFSSKEVGSPHSIPASPGIEAPAGQTGTGRDPTASLLKNVNNSLLYQSVLNSANSSQTALEGHSKYHSSNPSGTVITPKSRAVPDVNSAVVNFAKVKQQQQQNTLPSMKRVPRSVSIGGNVATSGPSHLKYSKIAKGIDSNLSNESLISESESEYEVANGSDEDFETEGALKYHVPKFGGYSNNAKLRASLLQSSHEIFGRVPWKIVPSLKGNGALKNAVFTAVNEKTITEDVSWVGTVGIPTDEIPEEVSLKISKALQEEYRSEAVLTDDVSFKGAYKNFCKQILWPTLHYEIPDNPNSKAFEDHSWTYYSNLNQKFADKIISAYKVGDTIWVHDYHLMLVPAMVRKALPNAKIGFFLHVSFPSSEVFRCFAQREKILKGILGANFVGFQTKEYARHFLQTSNRLLMTDVIDNELKYNGKIVSVKYTPVGIDLFNLNAQSRNEEVYQWRQLIKEKWKGKKLIVCRDQFDRVRGLKKKMLAYERFLRENPEYIDKVTMIQICIGSQKDADLEREIMVVVDRINSLSPNISISQPVVFLHQDLDFQQYLALSAEADMFMVDPLREGMNLTCHEFIACSEEKNAPLLLSEFTGSAEVLKGGALLINPWDIKYVSQTIKRALEMSSEERRRYWKKMVKSVINNDSDNWIITSLQDINSSWEFNKERSTVFNLSYKQILSDYGISKKHMFIFKISEPPTSRMLSILNDLSSKNIVYVMNSFSKTTLESLYSRVLNLGLIAENGAYVRLNGSWYNIVEQVDWKSEVVKILDDKVERLPGSYYKVADSMIRFHTENAEDRDRVAGVVGEATTHINTLFGEKGIHAYLHKNIVFVQETGLSLTATQFLFKFYNSTTEAYDNSSIPVTPNDIGATATSRGGYFTSKGKSQYHIDFACVTGSSSPVIEPIFQLIKDEVNNGGLRFGYSVVYDGATSTYAKEHVDGLNELFNILAQITKLPHR